MNDQLTIPGLDALTAQPGYVLWYMPSGRRRAWEPVHHDKTERACLDAIGCGGRHGGRWLILAAGTEPDA